jgi:hypothetical protein
MLAENSKAKSMKNEDEQGNPSQNILVPTPRRDAVEVENEEQKY